MGKPAHCIAANLEHEKSSQKREDEIVNRKSVRRHGLSPIIQVIHLIAVTPAFVLQYYAACVLVCAVLLMTNAIHTPSESGVRALAKQEKKIK